MSNRIGWLAMRDGRNKCIIMKINVFVFSCLLLLAGCRLFQSHDIQFLSQASGLNIPDNISSIKYQYVRNSDYNFPYLFCSRFKCDTEAYLIVRRQISVNSRTDLNDRNSIISSRLLANDKEYLYAYNQVPWWDVRNTVTPSKLLVNYFDDGGKKRIGDSTRFNGKIAVYYNKPYCYLYIACSPPQ